MPNPNYILTPEGWFWTPEFAAGVEAVATLIEEESRKKHPPEHPSHPVYSALPKGTEHLGDLFIDTIGQEAVIRSRRFRK